MGHDSTGDTFRTFSRIQQDLSAREQDVTDLTPLGWGSRPRGVSAAQIPVYLTLVTDTGDRITQVTGRQATLHLSPAHCGSAG